MCACPLKHAATNNAGTRRFPVWGMTKPVLMLFALFVLMAPPLQADDNRVAVSFIPGVPGMTEALEESGVFWLGVDMKIKEGWHIYWRNPGDSGLPTTIRWNPHPSLSPGEIHWPRPSRFDEDGITTYGYSDRVTLLVPVSLTQGGPPPDYDTCVDTAGETSGNTSGRPSVDASGEIFKDAPGDTSGNLPESGIDCGKENGSPFGGGFSEQPLSADLNWLVCKDICLPESATVSIAVGERGSFEGYSGSGADRISQSMNLVPDTVEEWQGHAVLADGRFEITLTPRAGNAVFPDEQDIYFYPDRQGLIEHTAPQEVSRYGDTLAIVIPASRYLRSAPGEIRGVLSAKESWIRDRNTPAIEMVMPVTERDGGN